MKVRPSQEEYHPYFDTYVSKVKGTDFLEALKSDTALIKYQSLSAAQWDYAYAPGKWNLKEVLMHVMDTERIFAYRALRISRADKQPLQGFEQDDYVPYYEVASRTGESLVEEYKATRQATLAMFQHFSDQQLSRMGTASGNTISVRALGFMIAGHEIHHLQLLEERYLNG